MPYGDRAAPTRYRGIEFRSITEARWALWLDAMLIPWEYEPQVFNLSTLESYLPDFRLSGRTWLEVKGISIRPGDTLHSVVRRIPAPAVSKVAAFSNSSHIILAAGRSPLPGKHIAALLWRNQPVSTGRVNLCGACGRITVGYICHECGCQVGVANLQQVADSILSGARLERVV